jgi:hypothetical protein
MLNWVNINFRKDVVQESFTILAEKAEEDVEYRKLIQNVTFKKIVDANNYDEINSANQSAKENIEKEIKRNKIEIIEVITSIVENKDYDKNSYETLIKLIRKKF